jgi:hypothetical protein
MRVETGEPCPLPEDLTLAEASVALADGGHWGHVFDARWRLVFMTDDTRRSAAGSGPLAPVQIGECFFGSAMVATSREGVFPPIWDDLFRAVGPLMLADHSGDRVRVKEQIDPSLHHLVDGMKRSEA